MGEGVLQFNVASLVEDVLLQHGKRLGDMDLASRKVHEISLKRYDAARWLRKVVGVVLGRDLPAEPSEENFRIGLRSGVILCSALNKIQPGAVPKIVEAPIDSVLIADASAHTAFQNFENVRNFLVVIEELGIPVFEISDLLQGGNTSRIVNCVLAFKSYYEWKQAGGNGVWKYSGNSNPIEAGKSVGGSSDTFLNCLTKDILHCDDIVHDLKEVGSSASLQKLVKELVSDKSVEDIPIIVESLLRRVKEEFERKLQQQSKLIRTASQGHKGVTHEIGTVSRDEFDSNSRTSTEIEMPNTRKASIRVEDFCVEASGTVSLRNPEYIDLQKRSVEELKKILHSARQGIHMLQLKYQEDVGSLGEQVTRLATQASGYQKVLEENRKLYNQVQDLKGNIRVYCRVRPFLPGQTSNGMSIMDEIVDNSLTIQTALKNTKAKKTFTYNKAFGPNSTQEEVFADTQPLIRSVLDGYNVCIFAYGQTGSGKTFTMTGPKELTKESLGVNYRALSYLFEISTQRKDTMAYEISVQMMEIYNEQVRDLLVTDGANKKLEIRNNTSNGINVPNANLVPVTSTSDVIELMNLGHKNRAVGSTSMNDRSSRSHSCLTVHVLGKDLTSGSTLRGCMHLVDLAGSERCDKTDAVGDRLKEAQHINRSLSALGDVISALAQKNAHVPYRNSKLTQLLQDSLGGQAKTLMFVHISPEPSALGETISTLKFAERVSTIELGAAKSNKEVTGPDVRELKEQIAALKAALARKEASSPDRHRAMSFASSPSNSSCYSKVEDQSICSTRRNSLDSEDSITWPTLEEAVKVKRNTKTSLSKRVSLDSSVDQTTPYDSDFDAATSEASEVDYQWQIQKCNSLPTSAGSKLKRQGVKVSKIQESRSMIPQPNGRASTSPLNKVVRQSPSAATTVMRRRSTAAAGK